jgi:dTDP-glucose 4,6-dehydratase
MDIRITRCSNNFGTHQFPEKMIPLFVTNLIDDMQVPLYGDGLNVRDWLHVEDHCRGISLVAEKGRSGEIYNIGGGTELTNVDLTHMILQLCQKSTDFISPVADRLGHDRRYSVDWSKSKNELGYSPQKNIADALPEIIDWYRRNEQWWRPLKK